MTADDETSLDVVDARLNEAEYALENLRRISDGLPMDDYCEDVADALNLMGVVIAELRRRRVQVDALATGLIGFSRSCPECGQEWSEFGGPKKAKIIVNIEPSAG